MIRISKTLLVLAGLVLLLGTVSSAAAVVVVDFDAVDASGGPVSGAAVDAYLAGFGITISHITPSGVGGVVAIINDANFPSIFGTASKPIAVSKPNFLQQLNVNSGTPIPLPISFEMDFSQPLIHFSFKRVGLQGPTFRRAWDARALDKLGNTLSSVGEGSLIVGLGQAPLPFTLDGPGLITSVVFETPVPNFSDLS